MFKPYVFVRELGSKCRNQSIRYAPYYYILIVHFRFYSHRFKWYMFVRERVQMRATPEFLILYSGVYPLIDSCGMFVQDRLQMRVICRDQMIYCARYNLLLSQLFAMLITYR